VTCSALKRRYRDVLRTGHPSVRFVHLAAPAAVVTDRMRTRTGHFMPPVLQASQAAALEPLEPDEPGVVVDATAPPDAVAAAALEGLDLT
jgi:gluconokinase